MNSVLCRITLAVATAALVACQAEAPTAKPTKDRPKSVASAPSSAPKSAASATSADPASTPSVAPKAEATAPLLSLAYVGCNRVGYDGVPPSMKASTANIPQLLQTFSDVANPDIVTARPSHLILAGDIVQNEKNEVVLASQLKAWQGIWTKHAIPNMTLVPFVGNHEVLHSFYPAKDLEVPWPKSYGTWLSWLHAHDHWPTGHGNGPKADTPDLLVGPNMDLTYSFDVPLGTTGDLAHLVVVNTDSHTTYNPPAVKPGQTNDCLQPDAGKTGDHPIPGWIPADWLKADIAGAIANPKVKVIIAFGHKPLLADETNPGGVSNGRQTVFNCADKKQAKALFDALLAARKANKVGAYMAAHQHLWRANPIGGKDGSICQVVAGNGGTPLQAGKSYGFTHITVDASYTVRATSFDRPFVKDAPYGPTTPAKAGTVVDVSGACSSSGG